MRSGVALFGLLICTAGCGQDEVGTQISNQPSVDLAFDCTIGFEQLRKNILARPAAKDWGMVGDVSQIVQDEAGEAYFVITGPKHPGHPAIFKRWSGMSMSGAVLGTSACAYGDQKTIEDDLRAYDLLDTSLMREMPIYHYGVPDFTSPTYDHTVAPPTPPPPAS